MALIKAIKNKILTNIILYPPQLQPLYHMKGILQVTNFGETSIEITWKDSGLIESELKKAALKGLNKLGHVILGEAQKIVPVKTGALLKSGTVTQNTKEGTVSIGFPTPYARKQHETHSSKAKYLERPFNELKGKAQKYGDDAIADVYIKKKYSDEAVLKDKGITE